MTEEQKQPEPVTTLSFHVAETEPNRSSAGIVVETLPGRLELRTNNPWEEICGHTRAVRRGPFVIVAGTTASDITVTGGVLHPESTYHQTVIIFERITNALLRMGAQITDIVRVRIINIADQADVCRAFKETFHSYGIRVPATLVQVNAFVHPDMRIEIEADAIVV